VLLLLSLLVVLVLTACSCVGGSKAGTA